MPFDPKVVELQSSNFRDIATTLHNLADEVASGKYGTVFDVVLVLHAQTGMDIFHSGQGDVGTAHILLASAQRKLEHAVISGSGGYDLG